MVIAFSRLTVRVIFPVLPFAPFSKYQEIRSVPVVICNNSVLVERGRTTSWFKRFHEFQCVCIKKCILSLFCSVPLHGD